MSHLRHVVFGVSFVSAMSWSGLSLAADPATAQALFDDAKKLSAAGRWAEACPKLEESQRLDPGIGTAFHLATCHEHVGRTATAWSEYLDVAASARSAGQPAREKAARDRAAALEPTLSRMTLTVANDAPGLVVTRDGAEVGRGQWGVPVPLDPGAYTLAARAPQKKGWEKIVRLLADGRTVQVAVPALADDADAAAPAVVAPPAISPPAPSEASGPPPTEGERGNGQRIAGASLVIVGLAGVGVGTLFGFLSRSKHDDADPHCDGSNRCDAAGLGLRDDAFRDGTISTVAFAAGGAAALTGAILWLAAPKDTSSRTGLRAVPSVGTNAAGLTLQGRW
jgi:hypothetical protein